MRKAVTTLLDSVGLLCVAAGAGLAAAGMWRQAAVGVSGVVILAGSWLADRAGGPAVEGES